MNDSVISKKGKANSLEHIVYTVPVGRICILVDWFVNNTTGSDIYDCSVTIGGHDVLPGNVMSIDTKYFESGRHIELLEGDKITVKGSNLTYFFSGIEQDAYPDAVGQSYPAITQQDLDYFRNQYSDLENIILGLRDDALVLANKVAKPLTSPNGTAGQLLRTNGDGTTQWVDEGLPSDEQIAEVVTSWLDNHPEATINIQDGSITEEKLNSAIKTFVQAGIRANIESGDSFPTIFGKIKKWISDLENGSLIANKVSKTGDTMSGDLTVEKADDTSRLKVSVISDGVAVSGGQLACNEMGNFGAYDNIHNKWLIRSDLDGTVHVPITFTLIHSTKIVATSIGISSSYTYVSVPALNKWNMVAIHVSVHENSQLLFFIRGEMFDRSLTDWPSAGKFRGSFLVDWNNNRIGMRCLNAGTNDMYPKFVFFDYVYGVL